MTHPFPAPDTRNPVILPDGSAHAGTVFLKAVIDHSRFIVGDYSYASATRPPEDWAAHLAPYLFPFSDEKLVIGKFCQIADGVVFITASANHRRDGFSTFPFAVFDHATAANRPSLPEWSGPDTVLGHDVWLGKDARVLPGARLGNGVIVSAGAVVRGEIPDYAVVAGNPARVVKLRFAADTIARLNEIAWWNWPIERILKHEAAICGADLDALERAAP
ncbi:MULTISPECIES: CatB-related O-acetyltransferase [unclassified Roseovarius]|uniref:CatB-related O-acetyltransferase n=1 Tax=unclassified Roseovarius TaxID=2614913 RepID=UPI00273D08B1|nr:CatB-related O-acetyltransferase [Roseovarius sp. MMSF_3350]